MFNNLSEEVVKNKEILLNGQKIKLHSFKNKKDSCALCGNKKNLETHHVSYEHDLCVTLCRHHHNMVHTKKHNNHPLSPKDRRQNINIKLTKHNTKNIRKNFPGYKPNEVVNSIIKTRLQEGEFRLKGSKDRKIHDIVSWDEFKKIGGSFLLEDPDLVLDFLYSIEDFSSKMKMGIIVDNVDKWLMRR